MAFARCARLEVNSAPTSIVYFKVKSTIFFKQQDICGCGNGLAATAEWDDKPRINNEFILKYVTE